MLYNLLLMKRVEIFGATSGCDIIAVYGFIACSSRFLKRSNDTTSRINDGNATCRGAIASISNRCDKMRLFAIATVEPNNDGKVIVNTCFDCTEYSRLRLTAMSVFARVDFTIALAGKSPSIQPFAPQFPQAVRTSLGVNSRGP